VRREQGLDQDVGAIDRPLRALDRFRRPSATALGRGDRAIDLPDADPRAVMRLQAAPTLGRRGEALGEVAARDRERTDELTRLDLAGELREWRCGGVTARNDG
jgi:hypothetical protein